MRVLNDSKFLSVLCECCVGVLCEFYSMVYRYLCAYFIILYRKEYVQDFVCVPQQELHFVNFF